MNYAKAFLLLRLVIVVILYSFDAYAHDLHEGTCLGDSYFVSLISFIIKNNPDIVLIKTFY